MEPAATIIRKMGGARAVAEAIGLDVSAVYRWTYARSRGGTGGVVPARHQRALLDHARRRGIDLAPADFFGAAGDGAEDAA